MWVSINAQGVAELYAKTRWRKNLESGLVDGIDLARFETTFDVGEIYLRLYSVNANGTTTLVRIFDYRNLFDKDTHAGYSDSKSFLADTTTVHQTADPTFDERVQRFIIPLGGVSPSIRNTNALNLPGGLYSFEWADCARIEGLINANGDGNCNTAQAGNFFGLRARAPYAPGVAANSPRFDSDIIVGVPRGAPYLQNVNAVDPDGESMSYKLSSTNRSAPDYGPAGHVNGLTIDQNGFIAMSGSATSALGSNATHLDADYTEKIVVSDPNGGMAEREFVLDAVSAAQFPPPVISPVPNRTVEAGSTISFSVTGSCSSVCNLLTLRSSDLPAGATFTIAGNALSKTGTFTWTPDASQVGMYGINYEAIANFATPPQTIASAFATIVVTGVNRPPVLYDIPNLTVGADPTGTAAFVNETRLFNAWAEDDNAGDVLTYSLPILLRPDGTTAPLGDLGVTLTPVTVGGRPIGRIQIAPDAGDVGVWQLRVRVDDQAGASDEQNVLISVGTFANQSPRFGQRPGTEVVGSEQTAIQFTVSASDPNPNQTVTLSAVGLPQGASFGTATGNPATRTFAWTPGAGTAGDYTVQFEARDNGTPSLVERALTTITVLPRCGTSALLDPSPRIVSLMENRGPASGGTLVEVLGGPFCHTTQYQATLGGAAVALTTVSETRLRFLTPPGTAGDSVDFELVTGSGATVTLTEAFLYLESTPPDLTCPAPQSLSVDAITGLGALPDLRSLALASDNVTPAPLIFMVQNPQPGGSNAVGPYAVTLTAIDEAGNVAQCTTSVTLVDTTPPQLVCPAPISVGADASSQGTIPAFAVSATDNVTAAGLLTITQTPASGTVVGAGSHDVAIMVTDAAGNQSACTTQFSVVDATPPAAPAIDLPAFINAAIQGAVAVTVTGEPGATVSLTVDDSSAATPAVTATGVLPAGGTFEAALDLSAQVDGSIQASATLTDPSGNTSAAGDTSSTKDTVAPEVAFGAVLPAPNANGWNNTVPVSVPFTTNDDGAGVSSSTAASPLAFNAETPLAGTTIDVSVTDAAGNSATFTSPIVRIDTTAPAAICAPARSIPANASGQAILPDLLAELLASDNISPAASLLLAQAPAAGSVLGAGTHTITSTVTDLAGNASSCSTTVAVVDLTPPTAVCPAPIAISTGPAGTAAVPDIVAGLPVSDNVTSSGLLTLQQSPAAGTTLGPGAYAITVTVIDAAGNVATCATDLNVADGTPPAAPAVAAPPVINAASQAAVSMTITGEAGAIVHLTIDDSNPATAAVALSGAASGGSFAGSVDVSPLDDGPLQVSATLTDESGNISAPATTGVVKDTIAPSVTFDAPVPPPNAAGWNSTPLSVAFTTDDGGTGVAATSAASPLAFAAETPFGGSTQTVTVTDNAGNSAAFTTAVVRLDLTAPSVTCPVAPVLTADATGTAALPELLALLLASDNLTPAASLALGQDPAGGALLPTGTHTVTFSATDLAGHSASCTIAVTVNPYVPPVADQLNALLNAVAGVGPGKSLANKVRDIIANVQRGRTADACSQLASFQSEVRAQTGKSIAPAVAADFIARAQKIRQALGCG